MRFRNHISEPEMASLVNDGSLSCRACGELCESTPFVLADAKGMGSDANPLSPSCSVYYKCIQCGSLNDVNTLQSFYGEEIDLDFIGFYADSTAGVEEMIEPVLGWLRRNSAMAGETLRFLEIGCGIGYTVDFCKNVLKWDAVGLEPGAWGGFAKHLLGVGVEQAYLGQGSIYDHEKFDIVYASEVIEHIIDPADFLETIKTACNTRLDLVLTTPNADYVHENSEESDSYSLLFPGEHKVLFSCSGITRLLKNCGFSDIRVETRQMGKNLVVYASYCNRAEELAPTSVDILHTDSLANRDYLEEYYQKSLSKERSVTLSPVIRRGLFYRLLKRYVNGGRLVEARSLLYNSYEYDYSLSPSDSKTFVDRVKAEGEMPLYSNILRCCMRTLYQEWSYLDLSGEAYPSGIIAYHKLLGFYTCTVIHHFVEACESSQGLYKTVRLYLSSLLAFIEYISTFPHSYYYLELMSLKGPTLSSLVLTCAKLGLQFDLDTLDKPIDGHFRSKFSQSYEEIMHECEIHPFLAKSASEIESEIEEKNSHLNRIVEDFELMKTRYKLLEEDNARMKLWLPFRIYEKIRRLSGKAKNQ